MTDVQKIQLRLGLDKEQDVELLGELMNSARDAILNRRFPFGYDPETVELPVRFNDLQIRIAMDLYNKMGAEGQLSHSENGMQRTYESSWISESLLREVTPMVGVAQ